MTRTYSRSLSSIRPARSSRFIVETESLLSVPFGAFGPPHARSGEPPVGGVRAEPRIPPISPVSGFVQAAGEIAEHQACSAFPNAMQISGGNIMDAEIVRLNIRRFRSLLEWKTDERERKTIRRLLAEHEAMLTGARVRAIRGIA